MGIRTVLRLRAIDLTSITCKALERMIHRNIIFHLDQQRILTDVQHGFCNSLSCGTQLVKTVNNLTNS